MYRIVVDGYYDVLKSVNRVVTGPTQDGKLKGKIMSHNLYNLSELISLLVIIFDLLSTLYKLSVSKSK